MTGRIYGFLILLLACVKVISASSSPIVEGSLSVGSRDYDLESSSKEIILNPQESITISFELSLVPEQVVISANSNGLQSIFYPIKKSTNSYELLLPLSKIPAIFKKNDDKIEFELICGDFNTKLNSITKLFSVTPSPELQKITEYKKSLRFGKLPEIYHIFKDHQIFVNPIISLLFIALIIVLFLGLVGAWTKIENLQFTSLSLVDFGFLLTLVLFEVIFVRYFIKDSIFLTISRVFITAPFAIVFGSRVLRKVRSRRLSKDVKKE
ncbi:hypothetical protein PACTADRAFT_75992 [Pachysolen tannophilus NRRL Y-2460]|uniref:Ribophorin II C-terminal domain-containing protein n=1 Tax=Pachysolen tannophilus NRRL Y-2460 TaxID=669874 RepID=A0A1E4TUR5_PACTA|nr:hypothetical protein PACTADRAFT_75992 [Pachysolen tannophilus NRRL Y-2460]